MLAIVVGNALAEVHHAAAFCQYGASLGSILPDSCFRPSGILEHLNVFLGIAAGQIEQGGVVGERTVVFRVEEGHLAHLAENINVLLVDERERFLVERHADSHGALAAEEWLADGWYGSRGQFQNALPLDVLVEQCY